MVSMWYGGAEQEEEEEEGERERERERENKIMQYLMTDTKAQ